MRYVSATTTPRTRSNGASSCTNGRPSRSSSTTGRSDCSRSSTAWARATRSSTVCSKSASSSSRNLRPMVLRKTAAQIALMRRAGTVVAEMHEACTRASVPGATTADLDRAARAVLERRNARSNFLGYHGFPAVACVSPNEVIVHGIPGSRRLEAGDIVSIDCGAIVEGWHADAAITVPVGEIDDTSQRLIDITRASLEAAIASVRADAHIGDLGAAVEEVAHRGGL